MRDNILAREFATRWMMDDPLTCLRTAAAEEGEDPARRVVDQRSVEDLVRLGDTGIERGSR
jgi:hypothetical protein